MQTIIDDLVSGLKDDNEKFECPACKKISDVCDFGFCKCPNCSSVIYSCNYCGNEGVIRKGNTVDVLSSLSYEARDAIKNLEIVLGLPTQLSVIETLVIKAWKNHPGQ